MRARFAFAVCFWVGALTPRLAAADEKGCQATMSRLEAECRQKNTQIAPQLAAKQSERQTLAADMVKNHDALVKLDKEIAALTNSTGVCTGMEEANNPKTCTFLGQLLDGYAQTTTSKPISTTALAAAQASEQKEASRLESELAIEKQPDRQTASNKGGTSAQLDPVESIQPITLAGAAFTLSGTRSGTKGVGTLTVNPLALGSPTSVVAGRRLDLSVSAPFNLDSGTGDDVRYVSARLRVNFTAHLSSAHLQEVTARFTRLLNAEGESTDELIGILEQATDVDRCVKSIQATGEVAVGACGPGIDGKPVKQKRDELYAQLKQARRDADSYYFGLDGRLDTGDPTGTLVVGDKGTHVLGGLAGGVRIEQGALWDFELRGRLAADYFKSRDDAASANAKAIYSFDWGAALILSGRVEERAKQRFAFGAGLEGRHAMNRGEAELQQAPTNYLNLNLMAVVPAANGADMGLALSIPLVDSVAAHGAVVNLSTDLGLLDHSPPR